MAVMAEGLTKIYGERAAIRDVSFAAREGRVTGFLGPNGAGKTTTLRCVLGLAEPTSGRATVLGRPYRELPRPARQVGALLDADGLHPGRTGRDHLRIAARQAGLDGGRIDALLELVGLEGAARSRVRTYSLGMRRRLALAMALLGDPEVLILDEPANGLDPAGMAWLRTLLRRLAGEGRTVLLSSHVLAEVAQTVDHVLVLHEGRLRAEGSVDELTRDGTLEETFLRLTGAPEPPKGMMALAGVAGPAGAEPVGAAEPAGRAQPGSTDSRGASPPWPAPLADRPGPEGVTLQVPGRSTMDGAHDAEASTIDRRIQAQPAAPLAPTTGATLRELAEAVAAERPPTAVAAQDVTPPGAGAADEAELDRALRSAVAVTRPNVVAVAGAKGGVGRTTAALLLADVLADVARLRVACVDADPATGTLGDAVGGAAPGHSLPSALDHERDLAAAARLSTHAVRLETGAHLYPLGPGERPSALGAAEYRRALALLGRHYDVIVCDLGAAADSPVSALLLGHASRVVVVSTPDRLALDAAADTLATLEAERTVLVLNRADAPPAPAPGRAPVIVPDSPALGEHVSAGRYRFDAVPDDVRTAAKRLALAVGEGLQ
jgi:ABC-2 type transport system ATP-binding protein